MNSLKSYFEFTPKQRNGIFSLLLLIAILQVILAVVKNRQVSTTENQYTEVLQKSVDSLKQLKQVVKKDTIYPFNPNFITNYKGYVLGLSPAEIKRLHLFRGQDKWVNSAKQFQEVTQVSDSLLNQLKPYFKFPEWTQQPTKSTFSYKSTKPLVKTDLNTANSQQLQKVYGIGKYYAAKIIAYRKKYSGFADMVELQEIYGLTPETIEEVKKHFEIKTPRKIEKISLNEATRDQLVTIPYIDYEIAHKIIEERTLREGFSSFNELLKISNFPTKKIEIIKLYLALN